MSETVIRHIDLSRENNGAGLRQNILIKGMADPGRADTVMQAVLRYVRTQVASGRPLHELVSGLSADTLTDITPSSLRRAHRHIVQVDGSGEHAKYLLIPETDQPETIPYSVDRDGVREVTGSLVCGIGSAAGEKSFSLVIGQSAIKPPADTQPYVHAALLWVPPTGVPGFEDILPPR